MSDVTQSIDGSNNHQNNAETINNYYSLVNTEISDQGIITEMFNNVLNNIRNATEENVSKPDGIINTLDKIKKNFINVDEQDEIRNYCLLHSSHINLIEKSFSNFDSTDQNEIHSYILSRYQENRRGQQLSNIDNFYALYKHFIPQNKDKNPAYEGIAKSIVLFFFQDCTIFEKTDKEREKQLKFFE